MHSIIWGYLHTKFEVSSIFLAVWPNEKDQPTTIPKSIWESFITRKVFPAIPGVFYSNNLCTFQVQIIHYVLCSSRYPACEKSNSNSY